MRKFFLLFLIAFATALFGDVVEDGLKQLSLQERFYIRTFWEAAIRKDQAAHVLYYMNKPVCLTGPVLKDKHKKFKDVLILKGWLAFKKNEHLFPHPNFIFSEHIFAPDVDFKVLHIYIINRQSLMLCLERHLNLFEERLGKNFSMQTFVSQLEAGIPLPSLLKKDEMLLGVLLGFGEESSKAFKKTVDSHTEIFAPPPTAVYRCIDLKRPEGCQIAPVVFMGNPNSPQVKELRSIYESELEEIWKTYRMSNDHLKIALKKLCETVP